MTPLTLALVRRRSNAEQFFGIGGCRPDLAVSVASARKTLSSCRKEATRWTRRSCSALLLAGGSAPSGHTALSSAMYRLHVRNESTKGSTTCKDQGALLKDSLSTQKCGGSTASGHMFRSSETVRRQDSCACACCNERLQQPAVVRQTSEPSYSLHIAWGWWHRLLTSWDHIWQSSCRPPAGRRCLLCTKRLIRAGHTAAIW